jgi:sterol desaturase/sphingolipid hydroxylase (fatty acid hydroxylase superfamily)
MEGIRLMQYRFIDPNYPILSWFRVVGNMMFVVGYIVILFTSVEVGIYCRMIGNVMSWPHFQKMRMWDILTIRAFFAIVEIVKLIQIWFF